MILTKHPNIHNQLRDFINDYGNLDFVWGESDCGTFVLDWIERCTGINVFPKILRKYTTQLGCMRVLKRESKSGMVSVYEDLEKIYNCEEINPNKAQKGDVGIVLQKYDDKEEYIGGVCVGKYFAVKSLENGLIHFKLSEIDRAWRL
jgi:hypothetical protein